MIETGNYFDPRTGEVITAHQFIERYTVNAFVFVERPTVAAPRPDMPGLTKFGFTCRGCGTSVEREGELCNECMHKPHLQSPMFIVEKQPVPRYEREHESPTITPE